MSGRRTHSDRSEADRSTQPEPAPWVAALEGYYGTPLAPDERGALIDWLAAHGYDAYVYSPKDDPYQRGRWRDPYPPGELAALTALSASCTSAGMELGLTVSPGLDWRFGDPSELDALTAKVEQLLDVGAVCVGIQWDDVPGGGSELGADHGAAVTAVARRLDDRDVRWITCPVDYAVDTPTLYLRAFASALDDDIQLVWTGPSVLTTRLEATHVESLVDELDQPLLFGENFPVNDLGMAGVLHLGPYPERDPAAMALTDGVLVNFMALPRASRIGLAVAAHAWRHPYADRHATWRDVVAAMPGVEPLARACRGWLDDPGPDPELAEWARAAGSTDRRLRRFLTAGCRAGLDPALVGEVEPWLETWEREASVMTLALDMLELGGKPAFQDTAALARTWHAARRGRHQVFGTRFAVYPATRHDGASLVALPDAVVDRRNLTDQLVRRALGIAP